jgi:predicted nucleic acid-binding protein
LGDDVVAIRALLKRYDSVPASLADACLIRLAELNEPSRVLTLDSDFHIYRRHGRRAIALITPAR